jgi:hypothetical protein
MAQASTQFPAVAKSPAAALEHLRARFPSFLRTLHRRAMVAAASTAALLLAFSAAAKADVGVYDASLSGLSTPATKVDRSTAYLIVNINHLGGDSVAVNKVVNTGQSGGTPPATTTKSAPLDDSTDLCVKNRTLTDCTAAVKALLTRVDTVRSTFSGQSDATLTTKYANMVIADLHHLDLTSVKSAADLPHGVAAYQALLATPSLFTDVTSDLNKYFSDTLANNVQTFSLSSGEYRGIAKTISNNAGVLALLDAVDADLQALKGTGITAVTSAADRIYNEVSQYAVNGSVLYQVVDARCEHEGFNSNSYTIKFTAKVPSNSWEQDVTCFPEFSVGGMYYVDWLNTDSYVLNAQIPVRQSNNRNQGSVAALLNWCPGEGGHATCATVAASSDTNGLNVFAGAAYLFAHRVIGINVGAHVSQINVLTNGYTTSSVVPSGATFQRKSLSVAPYVGLTLNISK